MGDLDPFNDPVESLSGQELRDHMFETNTQLAEEVRREIATIFTELFARCSRTHAFLVFMNACIVRFLRANRSGIIVSRAVDYREHPDILESFITRFYYLSDSQRGIDTTVTCISKPSTPQAYLDLANSSSDLSSSARTQSSPFWRIEMPHAANTLSHAFVGVPRKDPEALISRGTPTFYVYDSETQEVYFLKDGWRADVDGMQSEADVLQELKRNGVPHVPEYVAGGDMAELSECQKTKSCDYVDKPWRAGRLREMIPRVHYWFLQKCAGKPLDKFKNGEEFVQALRDALEGVYKIRWVQLLLIVCHQLQC